MDSPRIIPAHWAPPLLSVMRMVAAFLLLLHGTQKLFGFPAGDQPSQPVPLISQMGLAGVVETFGGLLLLVGLFSHVVAFILSGEMAVAYFQAHFPNGFLPIVNHGELPALLCFVLLYLAAAGPGPWSLDALRWRRPRGTL
ncbi:MAG: DoxX family protein [Gemmatimonadales bacterium]|nr:DoxX family protein [Gemmatimonadales bacterium]